MRKFLALLVALGMIITVARPVSVYANGGDNWFEDDFPVDIPVAG